MDVKKVAVRMKRIGPKSAQFMARQTMKNLAASAAAPAKTPELVAYQAKEKYALPVVYQGKIVTIGSSAPTVVDWNLMPYQSKAHIKRAVKVGHVMSVPVPAAAPVVGKATPDEPKPKFEALAKKA